MPMIIIHHDVMLIMSELFNLRNSVQSRAQSINSVRSPLPMGVQQTVDSGINASEGGRRNRKKTTSTGGGSNDKNAMQLRLLYPDFGLAEIIINPVTEVKCLQSEGWLTVIVGIWTTVKSRV